MNLNKLEEITGQLMLARNAFEAHLPEQAQVHIKRVLQLDPGNAIARILEARLKLRQNQPRQALSALDAHNLYHPESRDEPGVAMLRAQSLVRCGMDELAIPLLEGLRDSFPDDIRPHRMLAGLHLKLNQNERAITALREVIRLEPADRSSRTALASLLAADRPDEAIALLRNCDYQNDLSIRVRVARLLVSAGRHAEAEAAYAALLVEAEGEETMWREAGLLADAMGDPRRAINRLTRAADLARGGRVGSRAALARAFMHAGDVATAARHWWKMTRVSPDRAEAWAGLMVCSIAARRLKLAASARKRFFKLADRATRQRLVADLWEHAAGGLAIANQLNPNAAETDPPSPLSTLLTRAEATLAKQVAQHPTRADAHFHLANCRHAADNRAGATEAVAAALTINPDYVAALRLSAILRQPPTDLRLAA